MKPVFHAETKFALCRFMSSAGGAEVSRSDEGGWVFL